MADQMVLAGVPQDAQVRLQVGRLELWSGAVGSHFLRRRALQGNRNILSSFVLTHKGVYPPSFMEQIPLLLTPFSFLSIPFPLHFTSLSPFLFFLFAFPSLSLNPARFPAGSEAESQPKFNLVQFK